VAVRPYQLSLLGVVARVLSSSHCLSASFLCLEQSEKNIIDPMVGLWIVVTVWLPPTGSCWPDPDPAVNALFNMPSYHPEHTLPPLPRAKDASLVAKTTFFGCDDVSSATSVVYMPNRVSQT
jgi:hypothetical protein